MNSSNNLKWVSSEREVTMKQELCYIESLDSNYCDFPLKLQALGKQVQVEKHLPEKEEK